MSSRMPTIKEIAKIVGISPSAVSRALHDHPSIGKDTRERVKQVAAELGYEPNQLAIYFQKRRTFTVGVIVADLAEEFFSKAVSGIEDMALQHDYTVLIGQSHDDEQQERRLIETMKRHHVDGLILSIAKQVKQYDYYQRLLEQRLPLVFFDCVPDMPQIWAVEADLVEGAMKAVRFLLRQGHRIIALINGPQSLPASLQRLQGYRMAMEKNRLKYDPNLTLFTDLSPSSTAQALRELCDYKRKPTAILAFNDYVALELMHELRQQRPEISDKIAIVSFANLHINKYVAHPPIASLEQFPYEQGQKAMELMMQAIEEKVQHGKPASTRRITVSPRLVLHVQEKNTV
ncbi:LacI family DNA-binding transcriptional regulator [Thermoflavifilum thermophilum]|uniref:Transcriptional regulator, LacI family n=1 Tax=Thermoflavifilum thermophilum TaxID=1393122 RepID=A0A1I7NMP4_9BACT|nr:LacI family DNA-binding transcriptional regulator [Thermoflavifilum thermophilum]SFV35934.1 transcriptional regulator, LacI family [Thermoflavifilum thermophilum]